MVATLNFNKLIESTNTPYRITSKEDFSNKKLEEAKKEFIHLLITELRNQDPTKSVDGSEWVNQLAQFSSLEQMLNLNGKMDTLIDLQKTQQVTDAMNLIGKTVKYKGNAAYYDGKNPVPIHVNLPYDIPQLRLCVYDHHNKIVHAEIVNAKEGSHTFSFLGTDLQHRPLPVGSYRIEVKAFDGKNFPLKDEKDKEIYIPIQLEGVVSSGNHSSKSPSVMLGNVSVAIKDIESSSDKRFLPSLSHLAHIQALDPLNSVPKLLTEQVLEEVDKNLWNSEI